jgi:AraC family transcriptional regulator, regulatory protein of adaptative response / DNA-3-methyladenine glycosylase II
VTLDFESCWRAAEARDARFDGWFFTAVTTTGIYCRPSCPARTPKRENMRFFPSAAAAQAAGFRACMRCRPDALPGSPDWDARADLVGRAMRLIADGVVDREGVAGLARRLGYTERHVHRRLMETLGAGPLQLARARRAQTARILLESTSLAITDVAFASGFASVRQFNDTIRDVFAMAPRELRRRASRGRGARASGRGREASAEARRSAYPERPHACGGELTVRLPYRAPFDARGLLGFLGARAVPGVEEVVNGSYRRSLRLPHGGGIAELAPENGHVRATLRLRDLRDLGPAVERCRRLLDLDSDPHAIVDVLGRDELLGRLVRSQPGRRVPGHVDGLELAVRAVIGQQVSVVGAATVAGRLVAEHGEELDAPLGGVTHLFPSAAALAGAEPERLPMPRARARALVGLAAAVDAGELELDPGADRAAAERRLRALPGIGPWTAAYVAMRALRDPDAFMATDLGVRRALERLGRDGRSRAAERVAEGWRPYRAYATQHLWARLAS